MVQIHPPQPNFFNWLQVFEHRTKLPLTPNSRNSFVSAYGRFAAIQDRLYNLAVSLGFHPTTIDSYYGTYAIRSRHRFLSQPSFAYVPLLNLLPKVWPPSNWIGEFLAQHESIDYAVSIGTLSR